MADIGVAWQTVAALGADTMHNVPGVWLARWPWPRVDAHKHGRGHLVVAGGGIGESGAARLVAQAGLRAGAGLVTCAMPQSALLAYALHQTAVMNRPISGPEDFASLAGEPRVTALVLGPGQGIDEATRDLTMRALATGKPAVLDADALTVFRDDRETLLDALHGGCVLTPHEGEFARLFRRECGRLGDVRRAAREAGCVVLLKGPDTVIADPGGRALINSNGVPFLATAGSGDVLAGLIGALLAQGVEPLDAAGMACWLHAETGRLIGPGLVAEDLPRHLATVLGSLHDMAARESSRAKAAPA